MRVALAAVVLLTACGGFGGVRSGAEDDDGQGSTSEAGSSWSEPGTTTPGGEPDNADDSAVPCETTLEPLHPPPGDVGTHTGTSIWVVVRGATGAEALAVFDASGDPIPGSQGWSGDALGFRPAPPLIANRSYRAEARSCDGTVETWNFRTGAAGTGLDDCDPSDRTFTIDLNDALWVDPPGIGDVLLGTFTVPVEVSMAAVDEAGATLHIAGAPEETPDACVAGVAHRSGFADGHLWLAPQDRSIVLGGVEIEIQDLNLAADMERDCSALVGGRLTGTLDTRQLAPALDGTYGIETAGELCEALVGLQVRCQDCGDGSNTCIPLEIENLGGTSTPGIVPERPQDAVDANPVCADAAGCSHGPRGGAPGLALIALLALVPAAVRRQTDVSTSTNRPT
jgi:hypothetical protein